MCGIVGKVNLDGRPIDPDLIRRMCRSLRHRGPDDEGSYVSGTVGLGHRRLAVIDLSQAGREPMSNEDGTVWITFNGEIYNFRELRRQLSEHGHRFRSRTDTETVLHLYEEKGMECLQELRGMFAFAVWDQRRRTLFLARDRLGQKPLFYYADGKKFLFASDSKTILQDPELRAEPDLESIHHYLTYGYVPGTFSAFKGIRKLPAAHYLVLRDGSVRIERYWSLSYQKSSTGKRSEEEWSVDLLARLREAVRLRRVSDVPVGAFLSGGIDSSLVVALLSELSPAPVRTFSVGFEHEEYNELSYARQVADRFATDHHEFIVRPDAVSLLPELVWHYSEPFADSSAVATYYLAKVTREHVTVALNGDGGDESFAGYDRYLANRLAGRYDQFPLGMRRLIEATTGRVLGPSGGGLLRRRARRFFAAISEPPQRRYARWLSHFDNRHKEELYADEFRETVGAIDSVGLIEAAYRNSDATDFVDATLHVDLQIYLPDDLLVKVDVATMAHSLEARSPLLDHELVEFCASMPPGLKLHGRTQKYILKKALSGLLPAKILHRRKQGFGVPIDHWFRHELREMAFDTLLDRRCLDRGYFQAPTVERLLNEHCSGRGSWHYLLWNLLVLELWHRTFIDAPDRAEMH